MPGESTSPSASIPSIIASLCKTVNEEFTRLCPCRVISTWQLPLAASPLGAVSRERWLYLGGGGQPLTPGDRVDTGELALVVQEAGTVFWRDEALYQRAILRRRREAAE